MQDDDHDDKRNTCMVLDRDGDGNSRQDPSKCLFRKCSDFPRYCLNSHCFTPPVFRHSDVREINVVSPVFDWIVASADVVERLLLKLEYIYDSLGTDTVKSYAKTTVHTIMSLLSSIVGLFKRTFGGLLKPAIAAAGMAMVVVFGCVMYAWATGTIDTSNITDVSMLSTVVKTVLDSVLGATASVVSFVAQLYSHLNSWKANAMLVYSIVSNMISGTFVKLARSASSAGAAAVKGTRLLGSAVYERSKSILLGLFSRAESRISQQEKSSKAWAGFKAHVTASRGAVRGLFSSTAKMVSLATDASRSGIGSIEWATISVLSPFSNWWVAIMSLFTAGAAPSWFVLSVCLFSMLYMCGTVWNLIHYFSCKSTLCTAGEEGSIQQLNCRRSCWDEGVAGMSSIKLPSTFLDDPVVLGSAPAQSFLYFYRTATGTWQKALESTPFYGQLQTTVSVARTTGQTVSAVMDENLLFGVTTRHLVEYGDEVARLFVNENISGDRRGADDLARVAQKTKATTVQVGGRNVLKNFERHGKYQTTEEKREYLKRRRLPRSKRKRPRIKRVHKR